jgi:hypothetical protein
LRNAKLKGVTIRAAVRTAPDIDFVVCGAFLRKANLRGADLRNADLTVALDEADLRGADLRGSSVDCSVEKTDFRKANLQGTDLRGSTYLEDSPTHRCQITIVIRSGQEASRRENVVRYWCHLPDDHVHWLVGSVACSDLYPISWRLC